MEYICIIQKNLFSILKYMCAYNILNMFVNNKYLALNKISAKDLIRKLTDCVMVARRPLSPPRRSAGLLTSRRPDWPAVSEQSLNSPRPDLGPISAGQRKYPGGTLQGWIGGRGQTEERPGGLTRPREILIPGLAWPVLMVGEPRAGL